jgi:hypothetical protein
MALTFVERTIRGNAQDVLVVDTIAGDNVIIRSALTSWDIGKLTEAEALIASDATVTTLTEALQAYIMPNTMNAYDYYTPYFVNVEAVNAVYVPSGATFNKQAWQNIQANTTDVAANAAVIANHETRITALEP